MGTRGLNVIIVDGSTKMAQYNQWDSYPGGQGATALSFLREKMNNTFKDKVKACSWITPEQLKQLWLESGASPDSDMVGMDVASNFKAKNFHLHRDCGAEIYSLIQNSENGLVLKDDTSFAGDSLFCEWAYVVDLDKNTFEVYKGFNQEKLSATERFAFLNEKAEKDNRRDIYYPIKLSKSYSLDKLPTEDEFYADFREAQEE